MHTVNLNKKTSTSSQKISPIRWALIAIVLCAIGLLCYYAWSQKNNSDIDTPVVQTFTQVEETVSESDLPTVDVPDGTYALSFTGGYETEPVDNGRPVNLIAALMGVEPQVYRDAFSNVTPEYQGHLHPETAQANKKILLEALAPYGVTNEQIDAATNAYRYNGAEGEFWPTTPASAEATVKDGRLEIIITNPGAGYNSTPQVSIPGYPNVKLVATIQFTPDFATNGSISSISLIQ